MKILIAIPHVAGGGLPAGRGDLFTALLARLANPPEGVMVRVFDGARQPNGLWLAKREIMLAAVAAGCSHLVIVDDDDAVCRDFAGAVQEIIKRVSDRVVSLESRARVQGEVDVCQSAAGFNHWFESEWSLHGALIFPVALIPEFLAWEGEHVRPGVCGCAFRIRAWLVVGRGETVLNTCPALAEHRGAACSVARNGVSDAAIGFIGGDVSGLAVDWGSGHSVPLNLKRPYSGGYYAQMLKAGRLTEKQGTEKLPI